MLDKQAPKVERMDQGGPHERERYTHPAFGEITVRKGMVSGNGVELFGSDLRHRNMLTITIHTAHVDRHLNRDWVHSDRQVVSFYMSEAQWAAFVSSQGGAGVPITFETRAPDDSLLARMPGIESPETMTEQFDREIRERSEDYIEKAKELTERIEQALADGKANKGLLKELHELSRNLSVGMPNTMAFVHKQMTGAMENLVTAGKIELEAHVNDIARRTGIETLRNQAPTMLLQPESDLDRIEPPETGKALVKAFAKITKILMPDFVPDPSELSSWEDDLAATGATELDMEMVAEWNVTSYPGAVPTKERIVSVTKTYIATSKLP
ncbi:hypothetical protein NPS53_09440 [Pseudomonas putida]|uniref:hypothetical protein n=1 Tax=Pseudomonas putida TaxID=303 RepID=UPI0023636EE1|nr:hypothetical protein [Pseudomonas putida]MDD2139800.1 hypothetical protein [Pseudomonas putida]HDS1721724.1 hypothetical protein [Pseudomonas putida]